jgi:fatty acid desaturase
MRKLNRFMEHFWLAVAIGTAIAAMWVIVTEGFEQGKQWLIFPAIALAMFIFRRITRKKLEAMDDRDRAKHN